MIIRAHAKINWSLDITGSRPDGFHLLDMLMQPVSLADDIVLTPSSILRVTADGTPKIPLDESNLSLKAAIRLKVFSGVSSGVSIHIHKRIPMEAGLGGGSADAAATLCGLNKLWNLGLDPDRLCEIGLSIGADVPFCIRGGLSRTRGIGEMIEQHECHHFWPLVIIQPAGSLKTPEVFRLWSDSVSARRPQTDMALSALRSGDIHSFSGYSCNVLEPVASRVLPSIRAAVQSIAQTGALFSQMSGSGSAVYGVYPSDEAAYAAAEVLSGCWPVVHVCRTQNNPVTYMDQEIGELS